MSQNRIVPMEYELMPGMERNEQKRVVDELKNIMKTEQKKGEIKTHKLF